MFIGCAAGIMLQSVTGYLRLALVSVWNSAPREKFFGTFLLVLTKFWRGAGH